MADDSDELTYADLIRIGNALGKSPWDIWVTAQKSYAESQTSGSNGRKTTRGDGGR